MYAYIDSFRKFGKTNTDNQSIKIKRPYPEGQDSPTSASSGGKKPADYSANEWITTPERSLGSNHVVFGGMMLPVSAMSISCFIETG